MLFSSIEFIYLFLPAAIFFYYLPRICKKGSVRWLSVSQSACLSGDKLFLYKNTLLFFASLAFYAYGEPVYVLILFSSILLNYVAGRAIAYALGPCRRVIFIIVVALNLGLLFVFKYIDFTIEIIDGIAGMVLHEERDVFQPVGLSLPIGISFYTFQILSYIIDVYRNKVPVQKNIFKLGLYISFFPQLIAGPIVRYSDINEQIDGRVETWDKFKAGLFRFVIGLSKKVLIANNVALLADKAFENVGTLTAVGAWLGAIAYTLQIYFDFSGYSDMAIGLGGMFGFEIPENFNRPYLATSVIDFWHRWHMSLSTWFRDYLYIPLGGNRRHQFLNLFIVWFCTGLWHGANWTFIVWGLVYFAVQVAEKSFKKDRPNEESKNGWQILKKILCHAYTLIIVSVCWVIFRSDNLGEAGIYIARMLGFGGVMDDVAIGWLKTYWIYLMVAVICCIPTGDWLSRDRIERTHRYGKKIKPIAVAGCFLLCTAFILSGSYDPFIYFNF